MLVEGFWIGLAFVIFIAICWRRVGRLIAGGLDGRAARIKEELDEAVRLREEAQALLARYQRQQSEAVTEAEDILALARDEAERQTTHAAEALDDMLKRREQQAMDRIARAEEDALAEVRTAAVDLAVAATLKLITEHLDAERQSTLVDDAIRDLDEKLH